MTRSNNSASQLPSEIEALISRVVRRARLRKSERRDVEAELRTHFGAGLAEGKTAQELVGGFGDARAAGRMIGRAKRRCRGIVWHAWVWSCRGVLALFALVLVMYGWAAWAYYGAEPTITRDYVKEFNAKIEAIPEKDRAWPVYRKTILSVPRTEYERIADLSMDAVEGSEEWQELRALVLKHRPMLEKAIEASQRDSLGFVVTSGVDPELGEWRGDEQTPPGDTNEQDIPAWEVALPTAQFTRCLSLLLRAEARVAIAEGDSARWTQTVLAGLRVGEQVQEFPSLISYLVSLSVEAVFSRHIATVLAEHPERLDDASLVVVVHALADTERWTNNIGIEGERILLEDIVQRIYGSGTGMITAKGIATFVPAFGGQEKVDGVDGFVLSPPPLLGPVAAGLIAPRESILQRGQRALDHFDQRSQQLACERAPADFDQWISEGDSGALSYLRWWPLHMTLPAMAGVIGARDQNVMFSRGLRAAIAVESYRREKGGLPNSLDELVPRFLPSVPIDTYSGKSVQLVVRNGIPIIYSIGSDMDDDGGWMAPPNDGWYSWYDAAGPTRIERPELWDEVRERTHNGDWILWPPVDEETGKFLVGALAP